TATLRRFASPAGVCAAILLAGTVRTAAGTRHPAPWGYRLWAFGALAYSDILALHEDRGAVRHPLPYLEDKVEYPVLLGIGMWFPSVLAPDRAGYFALTFALLAACALLSLWFICALPGTQPWVWAASPALLVYGALNWDLFGILPLAAGRRRPQIRDHGEYRLRDRRARGGAGHRGRRAAHPAARSAPRRVCARLSFLHRQQGLLAPVLAVGRGAARAGGDSRLARRRGVGARLRGLRHQLHASAPPGRPRLGAGHLVRPRRVLADGRGPLCGARRLRAGRRPAPS